MSYKLSLFFLLIVVSSKSFAQTNKEKNTRPTSREPNATENEYAPENSKKNSINYDDPEQDFYNRMQDLQKTKRKNARLMEKPQYSNPMYFGHKRPPKKHKPSKMKFCKVCGIRH